MGRIAIYPGTFDPVSYGHLDLIVRAKQVFERVIVAVVRNSHKPTLFSAEERLEMVSQAQKKMPEVEADIFDGLVIDYARSRGVKVLIRGLRMITDFEFEFQMALTNRRLGKDVETVFLMPSENYTFLSSTLLKETASMGADISSFVPSFVEKKLQERLSK